MSELALNASLIESLENPEIGQKIVWDSILKGFGIRLTKNSKTFVCESRVAGRKRRVTIGKYSILTVADARKEAKKLLGQMASDVDPNQKKAEARARSITLKEALDTYIKQRVSSGRLKSSTAKTYQRHAQSYFSDWLNKDLKSITPTVATRRFDKLTDERGPQVANLAFREFRAVYNRARAATASDSGEYLLPPNPCDRFTHLEKWHRQTPRSGHLPDEQFQPFFEALRTSESPAFADFAELLIRTGLRRNEAATLRWSDINMDYRTLTIRAEIAKNGTSLTLPLAEQTHALFRRRLDAAPSATAVFATSQRYDPRKSLLRFRKQISLEITFHDLRRTAATVAQRSGMPYGFLKAMLNHSSKGDVTLAHYLPYTGPEEMRPFVQALSDKIDELAKTSN